METILGPVIAVVFYNVWTLLLTILTPALIAILAFTRDEWREYQHRRYWRIKQTRARIRSEHHDRPADLPPSWQTPQS